MQQAIAYTVHPEFTGILQMTASGVGKTELPELWVKPTSDFEPNKNQGNDEFQTQLSGCIEPSESEFKVDTPDHTWVGYITYVSTNEGWLCLAVLLDLFNREIVGWSTSSRMTR
jgi:transposase InsO family protein